MKSLNPCNTFTSHDFRKFYEEFTGYELNLDSEKDYFLIHRIQNLEFGEYSTIFKEIQRLGFESVYDIGCGYGLHIGWFIKEGYNYTGIDEYDNGRYENIKDNCNLILGRKYPFPLHPGPNSCAISVAALGSRFTESEIPSQMEMLSSEFSHFFCYTFSDSHELMKKFWNHSEILFESPTQYSFLDSKTVHYWN